MTSDRSSTAERRERVLTVARGKTINGTYRLPPGEALAAFRADLIALLTGAHPHVQ